MSPCPFGRTSTDFLVAKPGALQPHLPRRRRPDHHRAHPVLSAPTRPRHPEAGAHLGQPAPELADRFAADGHGAVILNRHGAVILNGEVRSRLLGFSAGLLVGFSAPLYVQCQRASLLHRVDTDFPSLGGTLLRPRLGRVAPSGSLCVGPHGQQESRAHNARPDRRARQRSHAGGRGKAPSQLLEPHVEFVPARRGGASCKCRARLISAFIMGSARAGFLHGMAETSVSSSRRPDPGDEKVVPLRLAQPQNVGRRRPAPASTPAR